MTKEGGRLTALVVVLLSLGLVAVVAPHLADYPSVTGDDVWILAPSAKLAAEGVLGSDMHAGFAGAERHSFMSLPVHHLLQAVVFRVFGVGIAQARAVALASALVVLWCVSWLAWRWYGAATAVIAALLLVLWRADLPDLGLGLPLVAVGRTGRYDMTGVAFTTLAVVLLDAQLRAPRRWRAFALGIACGLATLSQFYGGFALALVLIVLARHDGRRLVGEPALRWLAAGFAIVALPYTAWAAVNWDDYRAQASLKRGRVDVVDPRFYLANVCDEPERYLHLLHEPLSGGARSPLLLALALPAAVVLLAWRRRGGWQGDRLLLTWLLVVAALLALLDGTNARLYLIVLWPPAVIAVAALVVAGWRRAMALASVSPRLAAVALAALLAMGLLVESGRALWFDHLAAARATPFAVAGARVTMAIPADAVVLGHERWWWPLRERRYRALNGLNERWLAARNAGAPVTFAALVEREHAGWLVLDGAERGELRRYPDKLTAEFETFLGARATLVARVDDATYGRIQILRIDERTRDERREGTSR